MRFGLVLAFMFVAAENLQASGLEVSFHATDVTPEKGVPLGGYGTPSRRLSGWDWFDKHPFAFFLKPSEGSLDPIRAKVMLLRNSGKLLAFVSMDLVASSERFRRDLVEKLELIGIHEDNLILSATHTHSGPGAISKNFFWQIAAVDRYQPKIYERLLEQTVTTVLEAFATLRPASLHLARFEAEGLQRNRRKMPGHFDPTATLILGKTPSGKWLGAMAHFAIHGVGARSSNLSFSADILGKIEHAVAGKLQGLNGGGSRPEVLFVNSASGDVNPKGRGLKKMGEIGEAFAAQAVPAIKEARPMGGDWSVAAAKIRMGRPGAQLGVCMSDEIEMQSEAEAPVTLARTSWWKRLRVGLRFWFPSRTKVWAIRLGKTLMVTWPGEPTTTLGYLLKRMGKDLGFVNTLPLALTNGHLAYFTSPEEYHAGGYESCLSLYGEKGGIKIVDAHRKLARGLR